MESLKDYARRFLRWSEKYVRTDMVYAARGGFWLLCEKIALLAFGFGMSVAFANLMEPEKYGVYKYVLSVMGIIGAFSLGGLTTAVNQAVARGFEGALKAGFADSLRWSVASVLMAGIAGLYYLLQENYALGCAFLIGGALSPLIGAASLYDNFLAGKQSFKAKAVYGLLRNGIPALAVTGTLFAVKDPLILLAIYFVSTAAATYFNYWDVVRRHAPHSRTDSETLAFGKHLSVMNIIDALSAQFDRVFAFSHLGGTALAIYSFVELVPDQYRGLGNIAGTLALPKMSRTSLSELKRTLPRKVLILFVLSLLAALAYAVIAPQFFRIFFPAYMEAVPYTQIYALSMLALPGILFNRALIAHMRKKTLYTLKIATALFRVVTIVALVYAFGLWGLVAAGLLYYVFTGMVLSFLFFASKSKADTTPLSE